MIRFAKTVLSALSAIILVIGCGGGGSSSTSTVSGTTSIVMGPSTASRSSHFAATRSCPSLTNGNNWVLTPDKAKVTFTALTFVDDSGTSTQSSLTDCTVTYDRAVASGSELLQCPVQVPTGNIVSISITIKNSFDLNLNDGTNCIYTDGTGFSATTPAGTQPVYSTFTISSFTGDFTEEIDLTSAFTVKQGDAPQVSIVADMTHATLAKVSSGVLTFDGSLPSPPVAVFASFGTTGKSEFYSKGTTADSINLGATTGGEGGVRVFYASTDVPAQVQGAFISNCVFGNYPTEAWSANAAKTPVNSSNGFHTGGYLGLDGSGNLSWAYPVDFTYASYRSVLVMPRKTNLGDSTTATCQFLNGTAAPAPASGDTYAAGAPTLSGTTYTQSFKLVAK